MSIKDEVMEKLRQEGIEPTKVGDKTELTPINNEGRATLDRFAREVEQDKVIAKNFLSSEYAKSLIGFNERVKERGN